MRAFALSLPGLLSALLMTDPDQSGCGAAFAEPRGCGASAVQGQALDSNYPGAGSAGGLGPERYTIESESLSGPSASPFGNEAGANGDANGIPAAGNGARLDFGAGQPAFDLETLGGFDSE